MNQTVTSGDSSVSFTAHQLAELKLPRFPTTPKGWYSIVQQPGWATKLEPGKGPGGKRKVFIPPPDVMALIEARQRGELPSAGVKPQHTTEQLASHYNVPPENVVRFNELLKRVADASQATVRISKQFDSALPVEWTSLIQELMAMHGLSEAGAKRVIEALKQQA